MYQEQGYDFMIRLLSFLLPALFIAQAHAVEFTLHSPCDYSQKTIRTHIKIENQHLISVGDISLKVFKKYNIPFLGTNRGFNSILETPTGIDSLVIISHNEMLSYGWCFSVNGIAPEVYPHEYILKEGDLINWWYGYAHFQDGEWRGQCLSAKEDFLPVFCQ